MGNCQCQATEAATVVLQHPGPGGRVERLYWPTSAAEVMRNNPGHHVALIVTLIRPAERMQENGSGGAGVRRVTHVRLLRPKDTLVLGQVYRLVTTQEVVKGLRARKQERMREEQQRKKRTGERQLDSVEKKNVQEARPEKHRQKATQLAVRARQWQPSLQSILEAGS